MKEENKDSKNQKHTITKHFSNSIENMPFTKHLIFIGIRAGIILFLALLSFFIWHFTIKFITGWKGLNWLKISIYPSYVISLIFAISTIMPVINWQISKKEAGKFIFCIIGICLLSIVCFEFSSIEISLYSEGAVFTGFIGRIFINNTFVILLIPSFIPASIILASTGIYFLINLLIKKISLTTILLIITSFSLILPFSYITTVLFPLGTHYRDLIYIIKTGYPVFWGIILTSIAVGLGHLIRTKNIFKQ